MAIQDILHSSKEIVPWRNSTKAERENFYMSKFRALFNENAPSHLKDISKVPEWACIDTDGTFIRGNTGSEIRFTTFEDLQEFLLKHSAISAYYGTQNIFTVDIDSKDVAKYGNCNRHAMFGYGDLKEGSDEFEKKLNYIKNIVPLTYPYCFNCVALAVKSIFQIRDVLLDIGADEQSISTYFSGQGAHLECTDPKLMKMKTHTRRFLASYFYHLGVPVDKVVTYGENRVLRIPGSLHGKVNRFKAKILPGEEFDINSTGVF